MNNALNFKPYLKFLGRNRLYTAINVLGLSVSLMFVILIAVYTARELSVDGFQQNADRIYVLGGDNAMSTGYGIVPYLTSRYPEIEKASAFYDHESVVDVGDSRHKALLGMADSTFFDIFSFRMAEGDPASAMSTTSSVLISESFARRVFGDENPMGRVIGVLGDLKLPVTGIFEDFEHSTIPDVDILMNGRLIERYNSSITNRDMGNAGGVVLFLLTHPGSDLPSKTGDMAEYFKKFFWIYQWGDRKEVTLTPLRDVYFSKADNGVVRLMHGDIALVRVLFSVGLLILVFAVINYINLTVAQTGFRAREMATRRLLGASGGEIFTRFILESTAMCALAFIVGLLLAEAMADTFSNILDAQTMIDVFGSIGWAQAGVCALSVVVLGLVSGIIPAVFISRYRPIDVTRGSFAHRSKMVFSKVFIVFQNVITIVLTASALTMVLQIRHMINAPMGFNMENILDVDITTFSSREQLDTFRNEVSNLASVKRVSFSAGHPLNGGNNETYQYFGKTISRQVFLADTVFMDMMGFEIVRRNGDQPYGVWINETAAAEMELDSDSTSVRVPNSPNMQIAGIVKDFRIRSSLDEKIPPFMISIKSVDRVGPWGVLVETVGDPAAAWHDVGEVHKRITGLDMAAWYFTDKHRDAFYPQRRVFDIVVIFAVVAIVISMLGLLAMSTYFIQQRRGEIAIRKVFGSTRGEMFRRLVFNFLRLVLLAFVIAVPIVWYAMTAWLSNYPYRIGLSPLIFIAAGLAALVIAALSVSWQSVRAANMNPVDAIRN
jgi:putative ABC transport system permease protein